jgi:hypothetical protein
MTSEYVGVVRDFETKEVLAVINPDDDSELDNPRWLLIKSGERAVELVRVPRGRYMSVMSMGDLANLMESLKP